MSRNMRIRSPDGRLPQGKELPLTAPLPLRFRRFAAFNRPDYSAQVVVA